MGHHLFPTVHALFYLRRESPTGRCSVSHIRDVHAGRNGADAIRGSTPVPQVLLPGLGDSLFPESGTRLHARRRVVVYI